MDNKQEGISIAEFFQIIFKRKLPLIISIGAVTALGVLGTKFGYNNLKETYDSSFVFINSSLKDGTYYNGVDFNGASLVSEANINEVINSNPEFASINVKKVIKSAEVTSEMVYPNPYVSEDGYKKYTLSILKSAFKDKQQAKDFFKELASSASYDNIEIIQSINYSKSLDSAKDAKDFETALSAFEAQYDFMSEKYEKLIEDYPNYYLPTGESLNEAYITFNAEYEKLHLEALDGYINKYGLVKDYNYSYQSLVVAKEGYEYVIASLEKANDEIAKNRDEAVDYIASKGISVQSYDVESYNGAIAENLEDINEYKALLDSITSKIDNGANPDAAKLEEANNKINNAYEVLSNEASKLAKFEQTVATSGDYVSFDSTNIISRENGIKMTSALVLFAILGVVVGAIINLVLEEKAKNKVSD